MNCNLTQRFINAFPKHLPNEEVIDLVNDRLRLIKNDKEDEFFRLYFDNYEYFPTPKRVNTILKDRKDLKKEIAYQYNEIQAVPSWNRINLFPPEPQWDGNTCILCFSHKSWSRQSCIVMEKDEQGYDRNQLCACAGGNPELVLYTEWVAENKRRKADNSQFIDYNHFYKSKYEEK
jgi:hypothetical protein